MCDPFSRGSRAARVQGFLQLNEDGIHLVVAALLALFAGLLTAGVVPDVIRPIQGPYREEPVAALEATGRLLPAQETPRSASPESSATPLHGC